LKIAIIARALDEMKDCTDSLSLAKSIGLPGTIEGKAPLQGDSLKLFNLAKLNKIPLLYLESIIIKKSSPLETQLLYYRGRYERTLDLTAQVSGLFGESDIRYVLFKTLKPFPYTPSDIDVLFWSNQDLLNACFLLKKRGFTVLDTDLNGVTMYSFKHQLNVDLTTAVAVSGFTYLDKTMLFNNKAQVKINGVNVQTLAPSADLVTVAAHCMYKEQMYLLSDYYTCVLSSQFFQEALELAKCAHVKFALETALKITNDITVAAFGSNKAITKKLDQSLSSVDLGVVVSAGDFDFPAKYPPQILLRGLTKKFLQDPALRRSLSPGLRSTLRSETILRLLSHFYRKGY
jgi:hypothetical protein